jgi:hypothetical protein
LWSAYCASGKGGSTVVSFEGLDRSLKSSFERLDRLFVSLSYVIDHPDDVKQQETKYYPTP